MDGRLDEEIKILLVDDNQEGLFAMESVLAELGHKIVKATSGPQALRELLQGDFAVILLDVMMPDMSGYETAKLIRARPRSQHTPIIFLTASHADETEVFTGYALGAVDYLFKPPNPEILQSKVQAFVNLYKFSQEIQRKSRQLLALEQRSHESQLAEARQRLELLQQREGIVATLTHDLKSPLIAAVAGLDLLVDGHYGDISEDQKRIILYMKDGLNDLLQLIQSLLSILTDSGAPINLQPVDLALLTASCIQEANHLKNCHNLQVKTSFARDLQLAYADPLALKRVLANLLTNAIKFTPEGGVIEIAAVNCEDTIVLSIKDSGAGIAPEEQPKIFSQFFQGSLGKSLQHGTGLGLYLCRKIIESLNGSISFTSSAESGTVFSISLPCAPQAVNAGVGN